MVPKFNVADYQSLLAVGPSASSSPLASAAPSAAAEKKKKQEPAGASACNFLIEP